MGAFENSWGVGAFDSSLAVGILDTSRGVGTLVSSKGVVELVYLSASGELRGVDCFADPHTELRASPSLVLPLRVESTDLADRLTERS